MTLKTASILLAFAAVCAAGCDKNSPSQASTGASNLGASAAKNAEAVKVEFYVMSQCPYGVQVMNGVAESLAALGPDVDFHFDFIGSKGADGALSSMHGPKEVTGDIAQLCAHKQSPANVMKLITCQNKTVANVDTNWEPCAKEAGIDVEPLRACINGDEGKTLLSESFARSAARGATGSPTIYVAGKPYQGRRGSKDFLRGFCAAHVGAVPAACASLPEQPKVNVTVISDKRCTDCNAERLIAMLNNQIGKAVIASLDYTDAAGRKLYDEVSPKGDALLPLVLFDDSLKADTEAMAGLGRYLRPMGSMTTLNVGAAYQPVCQNEGGCKLEACKNTLACRKEQPNRLDVFVMSQCPYGVQALNAMKEVLANFDGAIDFNVNYIGSGNAKDGFSVAAWARRSRRRSARTVRRQEVRPEGQVHELRALPQRRHLLERVAKVRGQRH